jgi:hypothetical protein
MLSLATPTHLTKEYNLNIIKFFYLIIVTLSLRSATPIIAKKKKQYFWEKFGAI